MKKIIKKIYIFIRNIFWYIISSLIPKDENMVVVGSWNGERFSDNSRFLYLYNYRLDERMNMYWVTKNKKIYDFLNENNMPVLYSKSVKSYWIHLRAKYHIVCQSYNDIDGFLSTKAIRINLWHGIPLKKIWKEKDYKKENLFSKAKIKLLQYTNGFLEVGRWSKFTLLTTSDYTEKLFRKCLINSKNKTIISNYPRMEFLINNQKYKDILLPEDETNVIRDIEILKEKGYYIYIYLPTFRDNSETIIFGETRIDKIKAVLKRLEKNKIKILIKPHYASNINYSDFEDIYIIKSDVDIYTILLYTDGLITDYSSVYMDYLTLNKPIIFFPYDYDEYLNKDRGLLMDYNTSTPGKKVKNIIELENFLVELKKNKNDDRYCDERQKFLNKIMKNNRNIIEILRDKNGT